MFEVFPPPLIVNLVVKGEEELSLEQRERQLKRDGYRQLLEERSAPMVGANLWLKHELSHTLVPGQIKHK